MPRIALLSLFLLSFCLTEAQVNLKDSCVSAHLIQVDIGTGLPAFDMADRFGPHAIAGGGYQYKTNDNWLFGFNGAFIFGSVVKEDSLFNNIRTDAGYVIGSDGLLYDPILWESGFNGKIEVGKITNIWGINPNSGLAFTGGIGYMQHKIWIYIDETIVPQLSPEYRTGYDRLSSGFMLTQYIGYYFFSTKYFVNFRGGIEFMEAFTQNRRTINYDTQLSDTETRFDMLINLKVSWNLPIYKQPRTKFYTH